MPYSDFRPELMGSAMLEPSGAFEAGSMQSFALTYTAGRFGVDDTGSIKIGFRFATDFGPVQFDDPQGQGYTTAEASNALNPNSRFALHRLFSLTQSAPLYQRGTTRQQERAKAKKGKKGKKGRSK